MTSEVVSTLSCATVSGVQAGRNCPGRTTWRDSVTAPTPCGSVTFAVMVTGCPAAGWTGECPTCRTWGGALVDQTEFVRPGVGAPAEARQLPPRSLSRDGWISSIDEPVPPGAVGQGEPSW